MAGIINPFEGRVVGLVQDPMVMVLPVEHEHGLDLEASQQAMVRGDLARLMEALSEQRERLVDGLAAQTAVGPHPHAIAAELLGEFNPIPKLVEPALARSRLGVERSIRAELDRKNAQP